MGVTMIGEGGEGGRAECVRAKAQQAAGSMQRRCAVPVRVPPPPPPPRDLEKRGKKRKKIICTVQAPSGRGSGKDD